MPSRAEPRPCLHCGAEFQPWRHQVKKGQGLYCTNRCKGDSMTTREVRTCAVCGGPIDRAQSKDGPYCSRACSNTSRRIPREQRAWRLIEKLGPDDCWECDPRCRDEDGYGLFADDDGKQKRLSRVIYELATGQTLDSRHVLHRCDNPPCCNPAHLWTGTNADNMRDRDEKGRVCSGERWHEARIKPETKETIRARIARGAAVADLANEHLVSQDFIRAIACHQTEDHV